MLPKVLISYKVRYYTVWTVVYWIITDLFSELCSIVYYFITATKVLQHCKSDTIVFYAATVGKVAVHVHL